jgi:hypothetical protein
MLENSSENVKGHGRKGTSVLQNVMLRGRHSHIGNTRSVEPLLRGHELMETVLFAEVLVVANPDSPCVHALDHPVAPMVMQLGSLL